MHEKYAREGKVNTRAAFTRNQVLKCFGPGEIYIIKATDAKIERVHNEEVLKNETNLPL